MPDVPIPPRPFQVRDTVRNISTDQQRIVRAVNPVEGGSAMLLVRSDENDADSLLWTWRAESCDLVKPAEPVATFQVGDRVTIGNNPVVGKITETRLHHSGKWTQYCVVRPNPNGGNMTHWVKDVAMEHNISIREQIDADIAAAATVSDPAQAEDAADSVAYDLSSTESRLPREYFSGIRTGFDLQTQLVNMRRERDEFEKQRDAARLEAANLEKQLMDLQNMVVERKPIPTALTECFQTLTLVQDLNDLAEADRILSKHYNEGWQKDNIGVTTYYSFEGMGSRAVHTRIVTLKMRIDTPPQPSRTTTGHHASLTSPFVSQEMYRAKQQPAAEPDAIIMEPVGNVNTDDAEFLGSYRALFRAGYGVQQVIDISNRSAIDGALARSRARIESMPVFSKSLHALKAGE